MNTRYLLPIAGRGIAAQQMYPTVLKGVGAVPLIRQWSPGPAR
jgi:hypothetical protein